MKKIINLFSAFLVCLLLVQTNARASSHREAPLISNDPVADNTDVYAFRSPADTNKVVLIANYIPFEHPAGGPNWYTFGEDVRYEIHVDNNSATTGDDIIYRFTFKTVNEDSTTFFNIRLGKQNLKTTYTLSRSMDGGNNFTVLFTDGVVPPPNIGPRSIENSTVGLGAASYDSLMFKAIKTASTGERVYCGPADDPFFVDLGGAFDLGGFRKTGRDGVAKLNCHSICIEVPISTLQKDHHTTSQATSILDGDFVIGVYASASRRAVTTLDSAGSNPTGSGAFVQVSRLGMPLTNEVIIPIGSKDKWNASMPSGDTQYAPFLNNPELALYMDDSKFGSAVPGLAPLRIQTKSLGQFDFRNGKKGLWDLKGTSLVAGTALDDALFGKILLPDSMSPRAVDLLPIFLTGVPNVRPYQLATGKNGDPLAAGKPFINNFLPTLGDYLRLNMAVPVTPRNDPKFSTLGIVQAAVLGLTDTMYNKTTDIQFIPNMDGFPNGRRLEDDVVTISLQAVSGVALAAIGLWYDDYTGTGSPVTSNLLSVLTFNGGVTHNDTTLKSEFPFVQAPWRAFNGPSYSTTPVTPLGIGIDSYNIATNCSDSNGSITLRVGGGAGPYTIQLYRDGMPYRAARTINNTHLFQYSRLPAGLYYASISGAAGGPSVFRYSSSVTLTPAPMGLAVNNVSSQAATATWTAQSCADYYNFQYRVVGAPDWNLRKVNNRFSFYPMKGLQANTTYECRVGTADTAMGMIGNSAYTAPVMFTTPPTFAGGRFANGELVSSLSAYPNPARKEFTVIYNPEKASGHVTLVLKDVNGKTVWTKAGMSSSSINNTRVNVSSMPPGIYLLQAITDDNSEAKLVTKVIVR